MFGSVADVVKAEKERAMLRHRRLRRAASLSRCVLELLAALSLLSWSSTRLPAALTLCSGLRNLPALLLHPVSAFLVGNVIIVTLVAKSNEASAAPAAPSPSPSPSSTATRGSHDHHHNRYVSAVSSMQRDSHWHEVIETADVVFEDKQVCTQNTVVAAHALTSPKKGRLEVHRFQRTMSADVVSVVSKGDAEEKLLRRSQSEAGVGAEKKVVANWRENEVGDDGDEFRRKIEDFIAKQMRFIEKEESMLLAARSASASGPLRIAVAAQEHNQS